MNVSTSGTLETIQGIALEKLGIAPQALGNATTLREAGIDSLAAIDLVFALEAHFEVLMEAEDIAEVHSLKDLAGLVDRLQSHTEATGSGGSGLANPPGRSE